MSAADDMGMLDCPLCGGCGLVHGDDYDLGVAAINTEVPPLAPEQRCLDCGAVQLGHPCRRCDGTGRRHYLRLVIDPSPDRPGRCHLQWWWGAGYTQALTADSQLRGDLSDVTADEIVAAITDPGIAIDDRRGR